MAQIRFEADKDPNLINCSSGSEDNLPTYTVMYTKPTASAKRKIGNSLGLHGAKQLKSSGIDELNQPCREAVESQVAKLKSKIDKQLAIPGPRGFSVKAKSCENPVKMLETAKHSARRYFAAKRFADYENKMMEVFVKLAKVALQEGIAKYMKKVGTVLKDMLK